MSRIFPIFIILLALLAFFGYINPTYSGPVAALRAEIRNYDSALSAAERFKTKESELVLERSTFTPDQLARLDAFLPDGVDNVQLILDLDALANRSGMKLSDFDISMPVAASDANRMPGQLNLEVQEPIDSIDLTMTGTGTYQSFRTFLTGIEKSLRPLDLVSLNVSATPTGVYTYGITLRLYWLR